MNLINPLSFLGYVISESKVEMIPGKVKAAMEWPVPLSQKEERSSEFFGFANFFHKKYEISVLSQPLYMP